MRGKDKLFILCSEELTNIHVCAHMCPHIHTINASTFSGCPSLGQQQSHPSLVTCYQSESHSFIVSGVPTDLWRTDLAGADSSRCFSGSSVFFNKPKV